MPLSPPNRRPPRERDKRPIRELMMLSSKDTPTNTKKRLFLTYAIYSLLPLAFLHFYLFPFSLSPPNLIHPSQNQPNPTFPLTHPSQNQPNPTSPLIHPSQNEPNPTSLLTNPSHNESNPTSSSQAETVVEKAAEQEEKRCDYYDGRWVRDATESAPRYNHTTCAAIKEGQNCIGHGRPDTGYLHYRWRPENCELPTFDPNAFLSLIENKHLAFVGDSMARNQLESLLCLLASAPASPDLVYSSGEDNKFRRWRFADRNAIVSIYWSPFLVKGTEKSAQMDHNELHLNSIDERWASDLDQLDMIVLSVGHWFLHPAVYLDGESVFGCHYCPNLNHTEVGFFGAFKKALKTALEAIDERGVGQVRGVPEEGPYGKGERVVENMDKDMRDVELEAVAEAMKGRRSRVVFEAVDVTEMALLRPDGHPGAYMHPEPFKDGVKERVQNDCVHWCLPGPIDVWNEVLLAVLKRLKAGLGGGRG
ncbi:hypothetical protein QJS10_CPA05g01908 [Acorus calamus]|uniref:Trichome birefringence-like N-terminal domain-containing protein n=1 Tax=Acorus calamus TaxID=4465 RepID=A0AAV9EVB9_ACOCL|nr:hypothetical protein QJS10_CPA05g01908 [Acorus calamus]